MRSRIEGVHPLAPVLLAVAPRERRFNPTIGMDRAYQPISRLRSTLRRVSPTPDHADGLTRRIADLGLAYRLGVVAAPAIVALVSGRRLPDLSAENILARDDPARSVERFKFRSLAFACLPDDPAAGHCDATVVETVARLRDRFHATYTHGWLADLVAAVADASPVNEKALWGMVASGWASAAGHITSMTADPATAVIELELLFDGDSRLRRNPLVFYVDVADDAQPVRHWRGVCCLAYRLAGQEMCPSECPLLPAGRLALKRGVAA